MNRIVLVGQVLPVWIPAIERRHHRVTFRTRAGVGIIYGKGPAAGMEIHELITAVARCRRGEDEVADVRYALTLADPQVNLARTRVDADGLGSRHVVGRQVFST